MSHPRVIYHQGDRLHKSLGFCPLKGGERVSPEGDKSATRKQHYKHYEVPTDLLERWACYPPSPQGHRIFQTPDSWTPKIG